LVPYTAGETPKGQAALQTDKPRGI